MFTLLSRKKSLETRRHILRFINEQKSDATMCMDEHREETRTPLNCGILLVPLDGGEPDVAAAQFAVTRDMTSGGIGIMLDKQLSADWAIVVLPSNEDLLFVRVELCHSEELGFGFHILGARIDKIVSPKEYSILSDIGAAISQPVAD